MPHNQLITNVKLTDNGIVLVNAKRDLAVKGYLIKLTYISLVIHKILVGINKSDLILAQKYS